MEKTSLHTNSTPWLKSKGYLHLTRNIDVNKHRKKIRILMEDENFIAKYAFYPLIHTVIKERKYKKADPEKHIIINDRPRAHKLKSKDTNEVKQTAKNRPLHYATHFDAIIYAYYASLLQKRYEQKISDIIGLSECITAYRKLKINPDLDDKAQGNGKSTIHFANEIFAEISRRSDFEDVSVLAFDIKSFFSSLDHSRLKEVWENIMDFSSGISAHLDHQNVFKATTKFNYVLLDDLRIAKGKGKKAGYDEKKLAHIRKTKGFKSFFESNLELRLAIKSGKLKVFANPFKKKITGELMGIPQGLPISAVLANMYLFEFDNDVLEKLVKNNGCYYRRYSDDIIIICNSNKVAFIEKFIMDKMKLSKVEISKDKTEKFDFRFIEYNNDKEKRLTSLKYINATETKHAPLVYLGFEYRGYNILIKSANIAKFYRRMINIVKRRARRAERLLSIDPNAKKAIFINQIKKLYKLKPKSKDYGKIDKIPTAKPRKVLGQNDKGEFVFIEAKKSTNLKRTSNYFSYLKRAAFIIGSTEIKNQLKKSKRILWTSINRHLKEKT